MGISQRSFNILGNVAIVNFSDSASSSYKKEFAEELLRKNKNIKTVLEKSSRFSGRLRKMQTRHIAGEKNKEVLYRENECVFRFHIDTTYFSPRLSNERKEVASLIRKGEKVLVMFAGVAPYSIVIAKKSRAGKVYSNEINREANKYAKMNLELNGVRSRVELINGDIKRIAEKLKKKGEKFEVIVMPRPNLKESFLKQAFMLSKKGTRIFYYDFCKINETNLIAEKIQKEARQYKKKIKILKVKSAGEIAPYKTRVRVDFQIL